MICAHAPGFDLCERRYVVDRLLHVPHLVRINHEYRTGRARILPCKRRIIYRGKTARTGTSRLGITRREVPLTLPLWVVDDRTYQSAAPQVIRKVCAHFHFEVVEAGLDGFFCQPCDLLVRVPWRRETTKGKERGMKWCQRSSVPRAAASFHQGRRTQPACRRHVGRVSIVNLPSMKNAGWPAVSLTLANVQWPRAPSFSLLLP